MRRKGCKIDYSIKHICIQDGDKEYYISFRDSLLKGIQVGSLHGFSHNAEIKDAYPPLLGVVGNMLMGSRVKRLRKFGVDLAKRHRARRYNPFLF